MLFARTAGLCTLVLTGLVLTPSAAQAQWYFQGYLGGNHTRSADVRIRQPSAGVDLTFANVSFDAEPLKAPQYYGYRFGRMQKRGVLGVEFEFLHLKIYARTSEQVRVTGQLAGSNVATNARMDETVQRYSMSHGLNFILANLVSRIPLGASRSAFVVRGGLGPTLPHGESVVFGVNREQYEWAGLGLQGAAGLDLHITGRISGVVEYKLTHARPTISIANGTGRMTAVTQQIAVGLGIELRRR